MMHLALLSLGSQDYQEIKIVLFGAKHMCYQESEILVNLSKNQSEANEKEVFEKRSFWKKEMR